MNATKNIFSVLKRLFSNDIVVRRLADKKFKVIDVYNKQAVGNLATNYLYSTPNNYNYYFKNYIQNIGNYSLNVSNSSQRLILFREYEMMDRDPIIASALDLYAEETTVKNEFGKVLSIKSEDKTIKEILENLFYDILNIDFNLFHWVRNLVKYGDMFMKLDIAEKIGIVGACPISVYTTERIEENGNDVYYKVNGMKFENYEIAHFRLLSDSNFFPYGKSMIEPARRIWKQMTLMEDAMLIHRIVRAPQKRVFNIAVGNIPPSDIEFYVEKIANQIKKTPFIDPDTGDYNLNYNLQNINEDFIIPTRDGENSTKIETLQGLEYNAIEDVEYIMHKLLAALRIPKAFLGYEESLGSKATLTQEDIRFARTIDRIQKIVLSELENLARIHLFVQGYRDEDLLNFELNLTSPSTIYEQEKLQLLMTKLDISEKSKSQNILDSNFIYKQIFNFTDEEIAEIKENLINDARLKYRLNQIEMQGNDPVESGQHATNTGVVRIIDNPADVIVQPGKNINDSPSGDVGRPEKIQSTYGTDDHILGRDPIGIKDVQNATKFTNSDKGLNLEIKSKLKNINKNFKINKINNKIINENDELLRGNISNLLKKDEI